MKTAEARTPPASVEAEQSVLGGCMLVPDAYFRIADLLTDGDFCRRDHALIFRAIRELAKKGQPFDAVTLGDWVESNGHAGQVGADYLIDLASTTPSAANIVAYAEIVREKAILRRLIDAGSEIVDEVFCADGRSGNDVYGVAQRLLCGVMPEQAKRIKSVEDGLREMVDALQARFNAGGMVTGVPTGIESLDELTGGFQPGNLIVLVGETSMGKTAMALQCALSAATHGAEKHQRAVFFSLEMTAGELVERAVANIGRFPLRWITQPDSAPDEAMPRISSASGELNKLPLLIDDQPGVTIDQICARATQLHMAQPLVAVFVDYLHILGRPRKNDTVELGQAATLLKNLAKTLGVPVVALHQLNRGISLRDDRRPSLDDLRGSGEIAETANVVIGIYRHEHHRPGTALDGYAEALVLKQRQGKRNVRAWAKSKLSMMRLESCDPPPGYTNEIESNPATAGNGADRGFQAGSGKRQAPRGISRIGRDSGQDSRDWRMRAAGVGGNE